MFGYGMFGYEVQADRACPRRPLPANCAGSANFILPALYERTAVRRCLVGRIDVEPQKLVSARTKKIAAVSRKKRGKSMGRFSPHALTECQMYRAPLPSKYAMGVVRSEGAEPNIEGGRHEFAAGFCLGRRHIGGSGGARLGPSGGADGRDDEQRHGPHRNDPGFHRHTSSPVLLRRFA
jgi:hypothetical protein